MILGYTQYSMAYKKHREIKTSVSYFLINSKISQK